jgi:hypothetical protein
LFAFNDLNGNLPGTVCVLLLCRGEVNDVSYASDRVDATHEGVINSVSSINESDSEPSKQTYSRTTPRSLTRKRRARSVSSHSDDGDFEDLSSKRKTRNEKKSKSKKNKKKKKKKKKKKATARGAQHAERTPTQAAKHAAPAQSLAVSADEPQSSSTPPPAASQTAAALTIVPDNVMSVLLQFNFPHKEMTSIAESTIYMEGNLAARAMQSCELMAAEIISLASRLTDVQDELDESERGKLHLQVFTQELIEKHGDLKKKMSTME